MKFAGRIFSLWLMQISITLSLFCDGLFRRLHTSCIYLVILRGVTWFWELLRPIRFYSHLNQSFRRNQAISEIKHTSSILLWFFICAIGFQNNIFVSTAWLKPLYYILFGKITRLRKVKHSSYEFCFFKDTPCHCISHPCVQMHADFFNILCFSCQGKSIDLVYTFRMCRFSW